MPRQQTSRPQGEVRHSQLITTYGVGSVVAIEDESFMIAGTDRWRSGVIDLHEPRLERRGRGERESQGWRALRVSPD